MRHVNGVYTQAYNHRHGLVGHLFQGRFKAILVDRDAYLFEVCRYVELNPVRAGMVRAPGDWAWSSYRAHVGQSDAPHWLDTDGLHGYLLQRPVQGAADARRAAARYARLVAEGRDVRLWDNALRQQIYLGDEAFVERMQARADARTPTAAREIPKRQRAAPRPIDHWLRQTDLPREQALHRAHTEGGHTMSAIAQEMGLSVSRVSRLIARAETANGANRL